MKKIQLLVFLLLGLHLATFAQRLNEKEKAAFDDIAFYRARPNDYRVIVKWVSPIRYKIYGDTSQYIKKEVDSTFSQIRRLTKLDIKKTNDDDEVNFLIVAGREESALNRLSEGMVKYANAYGGFYFKSNSKSEIYRAENLIFPESYRDRTPLRHSLKKNLLRSIGLLSPTERNANSLFYSDHNDKLKIDDFDAHIISVFYQESIKPGMTKAEVDAILNAKN